METHRFNQLSGCYVPVDDSHCMLCGNIIYANNADRIYYVKFRHKISNNVISVGVPICKRCKSIHSKAAILSALSTLALLISLPAAMFLVIYLFNLEGFAFIVPILAVMIALFVLPQKCYNKTYAKIIKKNNICSFEEGLSQYEIIQHLIQNGYKLDAT